MRLFIKRIALIICFFIGLIALLIIGTSLLERKYTNFKLPKDVKHIVIGHSHSECAYNDSLIPNFKNLSQSGDSYLYSYIKTKEFIKQNPSIETVFVEFTNNQIVKDINQWIWSDKYLAYKYPLYASFTDFNDNLLLLKHNPLAYTNALALSLNTKSTRVFKKNSAYLNQLGGYLYLERNKTDSILNSQNSIKDNVLVEKIELSETNLSYLDALIKFCKENDKRVILIRSPLHKKYNEYHNEAIYKKLLTMRYANIEYIDFSKFPLNNSEFGDLQHLNHKGAKVFSEWFATTLEDGLLDKNNKQDYIKKIIKQLRNQQIIVHE
ncbi:hypothetical protein [Winogradskyella vidalii]|uniref:hypothetical protein n=1 Tax=Winogradskyella vidalii TaxID=2615024 RepID=UPI0015CAC684|nr:hypothetical protein [Winogradskyella vidalii]